MMSIALDRWTSRHLVEVTPIPHVDPEMASRLGGYFEVTVSPEMKVETRFGRDIIAIDLERLLGIEASA